MKKFLIISMIMHVIALYAFYKIPPEDQKKAKEFITSLVSPNELIPPEVIKPQQAPRIPAVPRSFKNLHPVPLPPAVRIPRRTEPTSEKPVVPGEGSERGKPLPEGVSPKSGRGDNRGEEASKNSLSKAGTEEGVRSAGRPGYSGKESLFDKTVIGETAKKGSGSAGKSDKESLTFNTTEYRYAGYMRKLKEKIESIWVYPAEARNKRLYGDLKIKFTIKKDGKLSAVELSRTSGYKVLDDAAIKALKDGEPYWPLPDEWDRESYTIDGHFIYTIYGYGIR